MKTERFWEVDFVRGIALILMVAYHFVFDAYLFGVSDIDPLTGVWRLIGGISGFTFVFLVGLSLTLSFSRTGYRAPWPKYFMRGAYIFGLGMFITLITLIFTPGAPVLFGVLHLIGASIALAYPFLKLGWQNAVLGLALSLIGAFLMPMRFDFPHLLFLGLTPNIAMLDYYPLLPWFGVVLLGIAFGNHLYRNYERQFNLFKPHSPLIRFTSFLGRNTLLIYFLHHPVILIVLSLARLTFF